MDLSDLRELVSLVEESGIQELEIEEEGRRIRIRKDVAPSNPAPVVIPVSAQPMAVPLAVAPAQEEQGGSIPAAEEDKTSGEIIKAPMIGTFYRAPAPEVPSFVQVGDTVDPDTVVCILEAMKVMNEIKAGTTGKVVEVLVENATAVEYGHPLFRLATE